MHDAVNAERYGGTIEMSRQAIRHKRPGLLCQVDFSNKATPHTANRNIEVPMPRPGGYCTTFQVSSRAKLFPFAWTRKKHLAGK